MGTCLGATAVDSMLVNNIALPRFVSSNGKPGFVEVLRNKTDSLLCSLPCRELRNHQHGVDLQQVFQYYSDQMPDAERQDIYNWECRMQLITRIALDLRQLLKSRTPVDTRQQMLAKVQKLEAENAQLRASQDSSQDRIANAQGLPAPPTSPTRASAVNEEAPLPAITHVVLNGVQTYSRGTCPPRV